MKYLVAALLAYACVLGSAVAQDEKTASPAAEEGMRQETPKPEDAPKPEPAKKSEKKASEGENKPVKDYVILHVNGEDIKNSEAEEMWKSLFPGANAPDFNSFDENVRLNVLRGIVSERLVYQQAVKDGFDKSEEVQKRLDALKKQLILQAFMESKAKTLVTDQQLKDAYAKKLSTMKDEEEVHARHILVATEDEAKAVEKELKKGTSFEKLAKEKTLDKASGAQGGDLGWFTKDKMVPEFAAAAFKLKKGEVSDPVKTAFGWHIIKIEDRRKVRIPSFEEMKEDLRAEQSSAALQAYVDGLLKKADVKYFDPEGKEKPFPLTPKKAP